MDDFMLRALLAGLGVALLAGPLGVFVVWRRMAYFGDTLAHSSLLGVVLGLFLGINLNLAVVLCALTIASLLLMLERRRAWASDTLLGILAHGSLALGLVLMALQEGVRMDLMGYLFGDILAVTPTDLAWVWGGGLVVALVLGWLWQPLLALSVHEELARVEGIAVDRVHLAFMLMVALVIAVSMKTVGILLISALLIIPAAAARPLSHTPEGMALGAALLGVIAVIGGLGFSWYIDTPAGPSVVVTAVLLFMITQTLGHWRQKPPHSRAG